MAFLTGIFQFRGKLGKAIGRANPNTNVTTSVTRGNNVVAAAPETVVNPKTVAQAAQRLRMRPAANFYRELGYILNHSWQGTKYRAASRNKFMQQALKSEDLVIPFLKKGDDRFVPGNYPLSLGSLTGVDVTAIANNVATTTLAMPAELGATIGEVSAQIIANNGGFLAGDKLTFVFVLVRNTDSASSMRFSSVSMQLVLNPAETTTLLNWQAANKVVFSVADGLLSVSVADYGNELSNLCAAACIHVRVPSTTSSSWQRSSSRMFLSDLILSNFMTAGAYNAALASYQNSAADVNSDWYLNTEAYGSTGSSGGSSQTGQSALFSIGSISLPAGGEQLPAVTITNVAAVSYGGLAEVIVKREPGVAATRYYNVAGTRSVQLAQTEVPSLSTRLLNAGYAVLYDNALSTIGITIQTEQGGGGETPEDDRP